MDPYGDKIRELKGAQGPLFFDEKTSNDIASYRARCFTRNLKGECANPNLMGEYGNMSWDEYEAIKRRGQDPEKVSRDRSLRKQMDNQWRADRGLGIMGGAP